MGILIKLVSRWIAGDTQEDALRKTKDSNQKGMSAVINILGEGLTEDKKVSKNVSDYVKLMEHIKKRGLSASISVKPSQLRIMKPEHFERNMRKILVRARKLKIFVWMDMEESKYTENTIKSYLKLHRRFKDYGLCIQANLIRSEKDIKKLLRGGAVIRLVKGAYKENPKIALKKKEDIDKNYLKLMKILFQRGRRFAVATHDPVLIDEALKMNKTYKKKVDYQFLMGIQESLKLGLVNSGYQVCDYVPFGKEWMKFMWRRIKERPADIFLILRSR